MYSIASAFPNCVTPGHEHMTSTEDTSKKPPTMSRQFWAKSANQSFENLTRMRLFFPAEKAVHRKLSVALVAIYTLGSTAAATEPLYAKSARLGQPNDISTPLSSSKDLVWAPVQLAEVKNLGMRVALLPPQVPDYWSLGILSVNGEIARGKSIEQIYQRLKGKAGQTIEIEMLGADNSITRRKLLLTKNNDQTEPIYGGEYLEASFSSCWLDRFRHSVTDGASTPFDLIPKAISLELLEQVQDLPPEVKSGMARRLLDSIVLCQSIGDTKTAKRLLTLLVSDKYRDTDKSPDSQRWMQLAAQNLIDLNMPREALVLCDSMAKDEFKSLQLSEKLAVLNSYSQIDSAESKCRASDLADKLYAEMMQEPLYQLENYTWLSNYLIDHGLKDRARALVSSAYEKVKTRFLQNAQRIGNDQSITSCQSVAFFLYYKAALELDSGNNASAKQHLLELKNYYMQCLSPEQISLLDRVPFYFPTPLEVEQTCQALEHSNLHLVIPPTKLMPELYQPPIGSAHFKELQEINNYIDTSKKDKAIAGANELVKHFSLEHRSLPVSNVLNFERQNLFCTLIGVARAFSDKGWYEASNQILDKLKLAILQPSYHRPWTQTARSIIAAEQICNLKACNKNTSKAFAQLETNFHLTDQFKEDGLSIRDFGWRRRLRLLAMAYFYAGYPKRASVFIEKALLPLLPEGGKAAQPLDDESSIDSRFLLLVDAACINTVLGDYSRATQFTTLAASQNITLDYETTAATLDLAKSFQKAGKLPEAIASLKCNRSCGPDRPSPVIEATGEKRRPVVPCREGLGAQIDEELARLLLVAGDKVTALSTVKEAIGKNPADTRFSTYLLAAQLAEQLGANGEAAQFYWKASMHSVGPMIPNDAATYCIEKAASIGDEAPELDQKILCQIYLNLAEHTDGTIPGKLAKVYKRLIELTPDSDPSKAQLFARLANQAEPSTTAPTRGKELTTTSSPLSNARHAAQLAEQNKIPQAADYWADVALLEVQNAQVDQSILDAQHAISLYDKNYVGLYGGGDLSQIHTICSCLLEKGKGDKAEALLSETVNRIKLIKGTTSVAQQWQLAQRFGYYVDSGNHNKAQAILDELLQTDLQQGPYQNPNPNHSICTFITTRPPIQTSEEAVSEIRDIALRSIKGTGNSFALAVLNKLLLAQRKQLPENDRRIGITLSAIAKAYSEGKDYKGACESYSQAIPILLKYEDDYAVYADVNPYYYNALRASGQQSKVDAIEGELLQKHNQEQLARQQAIKNAQAERIRDQEHEKELKAELEQKDIGLTNFTISKHLIDLKQLEALAAHLRQFEAQQASWENTPELQANIDWLERFGRGYELPKLSARVIAERIKLEERQQKPKTDILAIWLPQLIKDCISSKDYSEAKKWIAKLIALAKDCNDNNLYLEALNYENLCKGQVFPKQYSRPE
jgi:hypothetical protein